MTRITRLIIFLTCIVLFFSITPWLILYSLGYKIDIENKCIVATGGVYVRAEPIGTEVIIDSKIDKKSNFFSGSVFVQNLSPNLHKIIVKKSDYFNYEKDVLINENKVTKLENITLFKNNIIFNEILNQVDYFLTSPDNKLIFLITTKDKINTLSILNLSNPLLANTIIWPFKNGKILEAQWSQDSNKLLLRTDSNYYVFEPFLENPKITLLPLLTSLKDVFFNPQNSNEIFSIKNNNLEYFNIPDLLKTSTVLPKIIIKDVLTYKIDANNIIWLSSNGNLYRSDILGKNTEILATNPPLTEQVGLIIDKNNNYKIFINSFGTMILENNKLFLLDNQTKLFKEFLDNANELSTSPDNQNIFYITNDNEVFLDHSNYENNEKYSKIPQKMLLNKFFENISNCFWLNNNYLIFKADNRVKISEIDNRQNINVIDLPDKFQNSNSELVSINDFKIHFNSQDKKIYILTDKTLISSESLLP